MPKYQTSDEREFVHKLAHSNIERINRIRRGMKMGPINREQLLRNYIESGQERDWFDVDGEECLEAAERLRDRL